MNLHLIDGTYELFRAHFALPALKAPDGREVAAVRGLAQTLLLLLRQPAVTHIGVAFDAVIHSFRNDLFAGYKTGAGVDPALLAQFPLAERMTAALGLAVWPMTDLEADDALATAAHRWQNAPGLEQVIICSPDKDLCQMVSGDRVVTLDRRKNVTLNEEGVRQKFGVAPASIPDYLALVGDAADGIPGIPKWGAKSAAQLLTHYEHLENIPPNPADWQGKVRGGPALAASLAAHHDAAFLYRQLATLRLDAPIAEELAQLEWQGVPRQPYQDLCAELGFDRLATAPQRWAG